MVLRRATTEADALAGWRLMGEAFAFYASFGAPGYRPAGERPEKFGARLSAAGAWGVVAEHDGEVVGIGAFEPARETPTDGPLVTGLAHVFAVFVTEAHWGDGTAAALLDAVVAEIAARGCYEQARLHTPASHARARRFYAREGWAEVGPPRFVEALGMELVELRRPIRPGGRSTPSAAAGP